MALFLRRRGAHGVPAGRRPVRGQAREARGGRSAGSAERFPTVDRVTTYGRASTLARRTPEDLALLAGRRAHARAPRPRVGRRRGADGDRQGLHRRRPHRRRREGARRRPRALLLPDAGAGRARGGRRARRGLRPRDPRGGRGRARRQARSSCACARRRWCRARRWRAREAAGEFVLPDDVEVAQELRDLLEQLGDARLELRSDHTLNLLPELEGSLPRDRERLIALLDEYLGWPRDDQARFAVGVAARALPAPRGLRRPARRRAARPAVRGVRAAGRRRAAAGGVGAPLALHLTGVRRRRSPAAGSVPMSPVR